MKQNGIVAALVAGVAAFAITATMTSGPAHQPAPVYSLTVAAAPFNDHLGTFTDPPECKNGTIISGATTYYVQWCGSGPDDEYPIKWWATIIIDDGGGLTLQCGLTTANRCVFLAPTAPPS